MRDKFMEAAKCFSLRKACIGEVPCTIRPMTLAVMGRVRARQAAGDEIGIARETIKGCLCDADGKHMFTDADDSTINEWTAEFVETLLDAINGEEAAPGN
jgi:hypothetical protein